MSALPPGRKRTYAPKGRSGCTSCKRSHVRCFEDKPECRRCLRLALVCQYESPVRPPKQDRARIRALLPATDRSLKIQPRSMSDLSSNEAAYYDYFRSSVAPAKDMESLGICFNFWFRTVPREAVADEAVRHLVIALGALDLAVSQMESQRRIGSSVTISKSVWNVHYVAALRSYNMAIAAFRTRLTSTARKFPSRTFLIYCLLQTVFESLQGSQDSWQRVLHSGFEVLKHQIMQDKVPIAAALDDEGIEEAEVYLSRLVAVSDLMGPKSMVQKASIKIPVPIRVSTPAQVTSPLRTCRLFNTFYAQSIIWMVEVAKSVAGGTGDPQRIAKEMLIIIAQMQEWAAYLGYRASIESNSIGVARLLVHQVEAVFGDIYLRCSLNRCAWDTYVEDCQGLLLLAEHVVQTATAEDKSRSRLAQGVLHEKLVPILNRLIENCKDTEVRRRGFELLDTIMGYSSYEKSPFYTFLSIKTTPGGSDGDSEVAVGLKQEMRYTPVGYTWDAESNLFRVKLEESPRGLGLKPVEGHSTALLI